MHSHIRTHADMHSRAFRVRLFSPKVNFFFFCIISNANLSSEMLKWFMCQKTNACFFISQWSQWLSGLFSGLQQSKTISSFLSSPSACAAPPRFQQTVYCSLQHWPHYMTGSCILETQLPSLLTAHSPTCVCVTDRPVILTPWLLKHRAGFNLRVLNKLRCVGL